MINNIKSKARYYSKQSVSYKADISHRGAQPTDSICYTPPFNNIRQESPPLYFNPTISILTHQIHTSTVAD